MVGGMPGLAYCPFCGKKQRLEFASKDAAILNCVKCNASVVIYQWHLFHQMNEERFKNERTLKEIEKIVCDGTKRMERS